MGSTRREFLALACAATATGALAACSGGTQAQDQTADDAADATADVDLSEFESLAIDMSAWRYDEDNDVYYQLGLPYCTNPATTTYESLAIFVPGPYLTGEKSGSTYACTINERAVVGAFTAATAPVLMPINTGTLSAQASPTSYSYAGMTSYLGSGCVYVYAGFRGRSAGYDTSSGTDDLYSGGSPWPVVDLKAAVRYLRYNADVLPFDASRVFVFGFGAGGGVSQVLGASGDSALFSPYLSQIGAATHDAQGNAISDAIAGSASWCPVTSFDVIDEAYEWSQGQYAETGTRASQQWGSALSQDLAAAYATWVNAMDLRGSDDAQLTLDQTESGTYAMGTYADLLLQTIGDSATYFLQNATFPYTYTPQRIDDPTFPGDPNLTVSRQADAAAAAAQAQADAAAAVADEAEETGDETAVTDGEASSADAADTSADAAGAVDSATTTTTTTTTSTTTTTTTTLTGLTQVESIIYDSAESYVAALNADGSWIDYSLRTQTASIESLRDFSLNLRPADLSACPFDAPDRSTRSNQLFGIDDESTLHFDAIAGGVVAAQASTYAGLDGWEADLPDDWADDLEKTDSLDTTMQDRVSMMNPLHFLSGAYEGLGTSTPAPHWRVNDGLFDGETSPCVALNVVLALRACDGVSSVDYNAVWGQGHVLAEWTGSPASNLVRWVIGCCTD